MVIIFTFRNDLILHIKIVSLELHNSLLQRNENLLGSKFSEHAQFAMKGKVIEIKSLKLGLTYFISI